MTAVKKAKELVEKYFDTCHKSSALELSWKVCKKCALITVDEILSYLTTSEDILTSLNAVNYWQEVKKEIEKL